ncbi:MAG: energy transducer TonB [Rhodoblastus sp.]|nr:energy transducer TonB [Rhodoblastus sp.]
MSLSASLQWVDAPVAPHAVADAMAAALRPGDMANAPPKRETTRGGAQRFRALAIVVIGHVALVGLGAFAWRESLRAPEVFEEIPVEIIVESAPARMQAAQSVEPVLEQAEAPPPAAVSEAAPEQHDTLTTPLEAAVETPSAAAAQPAPDQSSTDDARARAEEHAEQERAAAQRRAAEAAEALATRQTQERAALVVRERAAREAKARAAQAAAERAELARERRAQAKRAAARERQAQAAQERRRIAARTPATAAARPAAVAFDAAGYRSIVARAVSASASRACSAGGGGRVVVALLIAPSGRVSRASVSSASGNATLDSAALSAVRRAGPFPAPSNRASVSVPVVVVCR